MLTLTRNQPSTAPHSRGTMYLLMFVGLIFMTTNPGLQSGEGSEPGGGCDGLMAAKVGAVGVLGGGSILRRVLTHADDVVKLGKHGDEIVDVARHGDEVLEMGRHGGDVLHGLDAAIGGRNATAALDNHWQEATGIVGQMAGEGGLDLSKLKSMAKHPDVADMTPPQLTQYAAENPSFWEDVGVALYLDNPKLWRDLGGDDLMAMAAVRSPKLRGLVRAQAVHRFDDALTQLKQIDPGDAAAQNMWLNDIKAHHGIDAARTDGWVELSWQGPDYNYRLAKFAVQHGDSAVAQLPSLEDIEERATSYRAKFDDSEAAKVLREHLGRYEGPREPDFDLGGLYAFRDKTKVDDQLRAFWVGPDVLLNSGVPEHFDRLVSLITDGTEPAPAEVYAQLWVHFHQPLFAHICVADSPEFLSPNETVLSPRVVEVDGRQVYEFWSRNSGEPCQRREIEWVPTLRRSPTPATAPGGPSALRE